MGKGRWDDEKHGGRRDDEDVGGGGWQERPPRPPLQWEKEREFTRGKVAATVSKAVTDSGATMRSVAVERIGRKGLTKNLRLGDLADVEVLLREVRHAYEVPPDDEGRTVFGD